MKEIRILSATGILGSGFREETLKRAMALEPHFIGADSGSTDPGPHYLGSGDTLFSDAAYKRDLRLMLLAGRAAKIPVIVGSACTSGSDPQLERLVGIAREIAREEKLIFKLAAIHSEQDKGYLKKKLREGKITPLANPPELTEQVIDLGDPARRNRYRCSSRALTVTPNRLPILDVLEVLRVAAGASEVELGEVGLDRSSAKCCSALSGARCPRRPPVCRRRGRRAASAAAGTCSQLRERWILSRRRRRGAAHPRSRASP